MKPARFSYRRARSISEALAWLADEGAESKVLAGGQSLVPLLNMRLARPAVLVDINLIRALGTIALHEAIRLPSGAGGGLRLGATVRHSELISSPLVARHAPLLAAAARHIGHRAIRNLGTLGGSLAHADPAAELPAVAVALAAEIVVASPTPFGTNPVGFDPAERNPFGATPVGVDAAERNPFGATPVRVDAAGPTPFGTTPVGSDAAWPAPFGTTPFGPTPGFDAPVRFGAAMFSASEVDAAGAELGERWVRAEDLCVGPFLTSLRAAELLCEVRVPDQTGSTWGFAEVARRPGDFALAGVAGSIRLAGGVCQLARLVAFGVGDTPVRLGWAERHLIGGRIDGVSAREAGRAAAQGIAEPPADVHASADYRRHLISVLTEQVLLEAVGRDPGRRDE